MPKPVTKPKGKSKATAKAEVKPAQSVKELGPSPILTAEQELHIADMVFTMKEDYGLTPRQLLAGIHRYISKLPTFPPN